MLQQSVGGHVDVVSLTDDVDTWLNDEGLYRYGINFTATRLARLHGKVHQPYYGPVIITGQHEGAKGATLGLTNAAQAWLTAWMTRRGSEYLHPEQAHQNVVQESRWLWHGVAGHTLAEVTGALQ